MFVNAVVQCTYFLPKIFDDKKIVILEDNF